MSSFDTDIIILFHVLCYRMAIRVERGLFDYDKKKYVEGWHFKVGSLRTISFACRERVAAALKNYMQTPLDINLGILFLYRKYSMLLYP